MWITRIVWSLQKATTPMAFGTNAVIPPLFARHYQIKDMHLEEDQPNIQLLPLEKVDLTLLLFHSLLHNPPYDHVHPRGWAPGLGRMLYSGHHVIPQHPPGPEIVPIHCSLSPIREHYVGDKVQCHDFGSIPIGKCLRMGCHEEIGPIIRGWSHVSRRERDVEPERLFISQHSGHDHEGGGITEAREGS